LAARWAQRDGAGKPLADQYQAQGLEMLGVHAQFDDGSVEAGLADMLIRMESGRFKVFKHLTDWFDEYRLYHRKDGGCTRRVMTL
jgi:Terminase RNaseH-like domain